MSRASAVAVLCAAIGCAAPAASPGGAPVPAVSAPVHAAPDTSTTLIPAGYGTLRQDDIALVLQPDGVRVTAIPLDEPVIRTLATDSYRALEARLDSKRAQIAERGAMHGVRAPRVWYVVFNGLTPDARFVPTDVTVTSGGRDFRPFDVIPLTAGFGEQRLQPRETQSGLLLFDEAVDVTQPITVTMGADRNSDWENTLHRLDAERAAIRARAGRAPRG